MTAHEQLITALVLDTTREMPAKQRADYLHALAAMTSCDTVAAQCEQLAQDLEAADRRQGELKLSIFKRRTEGTR